MALTPASVSDARRRVRTVAEELGMSSTLVDDLVVITSELTTNALRHGGGRLVCHGGRPVAGLPELWLYLRGSKRPELVTTVFDTGDFWASAVPAPASGRDVIGEDGRGLQIIAALAEAAGGQWGVHPSRSRLGEQRLAGTAVWVALPVSEPVRLPLTRAVGPDESIGRLVELLRSRGVGGLIARATGQEAVLSLPRLTVWFRQGTYIWQGTTGRLSADAGDVVDAAEQIIAEYERAR
ncbi:ATP-binding protein [Actinoallomurus vinaceus]